MYNDFKSTAYQKAGDYNLSSFINLIPYTYDVDGADLQRINIHGLVQEISIYESIDANVITGNMVIVDASNVFGEIPITGLERLEFTVATPGVSKFYDFTVESGEPVFVHKIEKQEELSANTKGFILHFCSMERVRNQSRLFSRAYHNNHELIVQDILRTQLQSKKTFIFEPSKSMHKHVFPTVNPFSAINYLANDTQSKAHNGAGYKFYETSSGFHFQSIESMTNLSSGTPRPNIAEYTIKRKGVRGGGDRNIESDLQSIENLEVSKRTDTLLNFDTGAYGSEMITHNQFTKQFTTENFNYLGNRLTVSQMETDKSGEVLVGQGIIPNAFIEGNKTPADMIGRRYFKSTTTKLHNNASLPPKEKIDQKRVSKNVALMNTEVKISVPGFFGVGAGDVVGVEIPAYQNTSLGATDSISGKYLVCECRQLIRKDLTSHTTHLTLRKDAFKRVLADENFDTFTQQRAEKNNVDYSIAVIDESQ